MMRYLPLIILMLLSTTDLVPAVSGDSSGKDVAGMVLIPEGPFLTGECGGGKVSTG
jgi:hypothetical protein